MLNKTICRGDMTELPGPDDLSLTAFALNEPLSML